jgi:hypothetical protein
MMFVVLLKILNQLGILQRHRRRPKILHRRHQQLRDNLLMLGRQM